ncbi:MAG: hypothetical protein K0S65_3381, partial [Labilithrix sp.]|nr:hypothetical protein [Labilithrix sp.]
SRPSSMRSRSRTFAFAFALVMVAPQARADEPAAPPQADEALEAQRERFRTGLEKYRVGAYAEAILIWENIYRELGPEKGYRLAFNLARAYEQFGDSTRAAESYQTYVNETARRREAGEPLEPVVEKQELEAKERLRELAASQGRIRIAGERAAIVKIDGGTERLAPRTGFVAYVAPGTHIVTFDPGTREQQQVQVRVELGKIVELAPPAPPTPAVPPPSAPSPTPVRFDVREQHPFSSTVLYVAAGITAISVVVPILLYSNARSVKSDYDATAARADSAGDVAAYRSAEREGIRQGNDYESARTTAYASLAISAVLGVATAGLAAYWLLGTKETRIPISAAIVPGGAALGTSATF